MNPAHSGHNTARGWVEGEGEMNVNIHTEAGTVIQLTAVLDLDEIDRDTVLLTVRGGKDTDLTIKELEALGNACLMLVNEIRNGPG